jgi:Leucine-rich repeat (LRR) protein
MVRYMNVSYNYLDVLPPNVPPDLEALNLAYNKVPDLAGLEAFPKLQRLGGLQGWWHKAHGLSGWS